MIVDTLRNLLAHSGGGGGITDHTLLTNISGGAFADGGHAVLVTSASVARDPGVLDDGVNSSGIGQGFKRMSLWTNTLTGTQFICQDPTTGAAVWNPIASTGSAQYQVQLWDNVINTINLGSSVNYRAFFIEYTLASVVHGNQSGEMRVASDGVTADLGHEFTFTGTQMNNIGYQVVIAAGSMQLRITLTALGDNPLFRYTIRHIDTP